MKFIITVDTEADNQWQRPDDTQIRNINFLSRFQQLCESYNFKPTYLLTYEVAQNVDAIKILKPFVTSERAEVGTHLHPWTNPPYENKKDMGGKIHRFPHELSASELKTKLKELTHIVTQNFGTAPKSFRAGRWGFDKHVAEELLKQGYIVDCSVTPKVSWINTKGDPDGIGGPDYRLETVYPHKIGELVEVPVTVLFTGLCMKEQGLLTKLFLRLPDSFIKKVINKVLFKQKWLRIFPNTQISDFKKIYTSAIKNKLSVLEFMIHSSELMPGGSPYAQTEKEIECIYKKLESLFLFLRERDVEGVTLTEFSNTYKNI